MIYYLSVYLVEKTRDAETGDAIAALHVFQYTSVRTAGAAITALLLSLWLGPYLIRWLKRLKFGQEYADKAEESGDLKTRIISKKGVPTMGGILIVLSMDIAVVLWAQWNTQVQLTFLSFLVFAGLGFWDDYAKIALQNSAGTQEHIKLIVQFGLAIFIAIYLYRNPATSYLMEELHLPFFSKPFVFAGVGAVCILVTVFAIVGSSNAVNLTDGLDGLAIGCTVIVASVFLIITYATGHAEIANYLLLNYQAGSNELTVVCASMIGAGLGFLWFNCHPAQVFMGDTGSLALGGALGIIAVLVQQPFVLVIAGGVFVAEALSVFVQRYWFKYTRIRYGEGRRFFLMAPLHHHFEKRGWYESQIVIRFFILTVLCGVAALSTLKLR